jgi:hypothetical protein
MIAVLRRLRTALDRPVAGEGRLGRFFFGLHLVLSLAALGMAALAWMDYFHPEAFEDEVVAVHDLSTKDNQALKIVEFERTFLVWPFPEGQTAPYWKSCAWFAERWGVDGTEFNDLKAQDRTTLWLLPRTRTAASVVRRPLALSLMAATLLAFLLISNPARRRREWPFLDACLLRGAWFVPEGWREETRRDSRGRTTRRLRRRRAREQLAVFMLLAVGFMLVVLSKLGVILIFAARCTPRLRHLDWEWMARVWFALLTPAVLMNLAAVAVLAATHAWSGVTWDDTWVWVARRRIRRSKIQRIALRAEAGRPVLEILVEGWDQALSFSSEPVWLAGVLEQLGHPVECAESTLSKPVRLFRLRSTAGGP